MKGRDAVHGVAEVDVDVGHVDVVPFVHDLYEGLVIGRAHALVELSHDRHELRGNVLDISRRPGLEGLCEDGVVGIAAYPLDDVEGLVELDAMFAEQTHELENDHRGMGVVDLDGRIVGKVVEVAATLHAFVEDELGGVARHEVLLIDAKNAPLLVGVVGIEEEREVLGNLLLVELDAVMNHALVDGVHIKEAEAAALAAIARDVDLVEGGRHVKTAEVHGVVVAGVLHPVFPTPREPVVRRLVLLAVTETLTKEAAVLGESDAIGRKTERGARVDEACGEPAQATVAE